MNTRYDNDADDDIVMVPMRRADAPVAYPVRPCDCPAPITAGGVLVLGILGLIGLALLSRD